MRILEKKDNRGQAEVEAKIKKKNTEKSILIIFIF